MKTTVARPLFGLIEKKDLPESAYAAFGTGEEYEEFFALLTAVETTDLSAAIRAAETFEARYGVPLDVRATEPE